MIRIIHKPQSPKVPRQPTRVSVGKMHNNGHQRKPIVVVQSIHLAEIKIGQAILTIYQ